MGRAARLSCLIMLHSLSSQLAAAALIPARGALRAAQLAGHHPSLHPAALSALRLSCTPLMTAASPPAKKKGQSPTEPEKELTTDELMAARLQKAQALRDAGKEPFAYSYDPTHTAMQLAADFEELPAGAVDDEADVALCGRIMTKRNFGKLAFFTMQARRPDPP